MGKNTWHGNSENCENENCDGIDSDEKSIFLDVACFFSKGNKDRVLEIRECGSFFGEKAIRRLIDTCLIYIPENKIYIYGDTWFAAATSTWYCFPGVHERSSKTYQTMDSRGCPSCINISSGMSQDLICFRHLCFLSRRWRIIQKRSTRVVFN